MSNICIFCFKKEWITSANVTNINLFQIVDYVPPPTVSLLP